MKKQPKVPPVTTEKPSDYKPKGAKAKASGKNHRLNRSLDANKQS